MIDEEEQTHLAAEQWRAFGRDLAAAEAERDSKTVERAARDAWTPGGPSVEAIEVMIRKHRGGLRHNGSL